MKKALYSFAMAIVMVAAGSMMSSCTSSAKNDSEAQEEKVEEVAEAPVNILETPMFAGIELTDEQKEQLQALVPPCAKACHKEEGKCHKEECDKAECDKPCEKKECDKAECDKPCEKEACDKPCEGQLCPDFAEAKAKFFEEVKAILTPEQFAQFEANVANCHKCNKEEGDCCKKEACEKAEK